MMPRPTADTLREEVPDPLERARAAHELERELSTEARAYSAVRGEAIVQLVEDLGWSLGDIAKELDVSKAMVQKLVQRQRERTVTDTVGLTDSVTVTITRGDPEAG